MDSTLPRSHFVQASVRVTGWCVRTREKRCQWYPGEGVVGWWGWVFCEWSSSAPDSCVFVSKVRSHFVLRVFVWMCVCFRCCLRSLSDLLLLHVSPDIRRLFETLAFFIPLTASDRVTFSSSALFFPLKLTAVFPPRLHHHPLSYPLKCWIRRHKQQKNEA